MSGANYAGDLSPKQAFELLKSDPEAVLVDVRTLPEWQFVGVPNLQSLGKETIFLSWQDYPQMTVRQDFAEALRAAGVDHDRKVLLLCRSGTRSRAAAIALTEAGFETAYNVAEGFEGDPDKDGHRGRTSGWKVAGLPWVQQ